MPLLFLKQGLLNLGFASLLVVLAASTGCFLIHKLKAENEQFVGHQLFYGFGFGVALISWAMLVLAAFGALNRWTLGALIAGQVGIIIATRGKILRVLGTSLKNLAQEYFALWQKSSGKAGILGINFLILMVLGAGGLISFLPTLEADSVSNYLNAARLFWLYGGLIDVGNVIGNMTKQGFMPMVYGLGLSSSILSQIWLLLIVYLAMLHLHAHFSRHISLIAASVTVMVMVSMTQHMDYTFGVAKVDGQSLAFSILALISWLDYTASKSRVYLIINAVAVGVLVSLTYMNLLASVVFFGLMLAATRGQRLKHLVLWSGLAFIIASPSYLFNWINFGNPLYPYYSEIFGHGLGDPNLDKRGMLFMNLLGMQDGLRSRSFLEALMLPQALWQTPEKFQSRGEPVFIIFWLASMIGALWLIIRPNNKPPRIMSTSLGAGYAVLYAGWTIKQFLLRYFSLGFPLIFWFGAQTIERFVPILKRFWLVNVTLLAFAYYMYGYSHPLIYTTLDKVNIILTTESLESYLSTNFSYSPSDDQPDRLKFGHVISEVRSKLKPGDKVLSFITGHYYLGPDIKVFTGNGTATMPSKRGLPKPLYLYPSAKALMADLRDNNFDYILIHPRFLYIMPLERVPIDDLLKNVKPLLTIDGARLIKVRS